MENFGSCHSDRLDTLVFMLLVLWTQEARKNANVGVLAKALVAIDLEHVARMLLP